MIRQTVLFALLLAAAVPALAGDLHGRVACKGVRDSADAVVYVAAIPGKTFPPPAKCKPDWAFFSRPVRSMV